MCNTEIFINYLLPVSSNMSICKTNSNACLKGGGHIFKRKILLCEYKPGGGGGGLTSIDPFCYVKTSHNRGLNNSELNFCICLSFSSVAKVQMYRVYYRIVFKRLRQHPLTTKLVIGTLSWLMLTRVS